MIASRFTPAGPSPRLKFVMAASPRMRRAAASYASAASSAVSNVPSHRREPYTPKQAHSAQASRDSLPAAHHRRVTKGPADR